MSRLISVHQEKGGVRKTFLAVHVTTYLDQVGHHFRPVDLDVVPGSISKIFPAPRSAKVDPSERRLLSGESRFPELMDRVLLGQQFVIDSGANTGPGWEALLLTAYPTLLDEMAAKGVKWTVLVPITSDEKTWESLGMYRKLFRTATIVVCVVHEFAGEQLPIPDHPPELTIEIPSAQPMLINAYRTLRMPIDSILASTSEELKFTRGLARHYLPDLHAQLRKIHHHLIP